MRKINKSQLLSTDYKSWEDELESQGKVHPSYEDAKVRKAYYQGIVMDLFRVQEGLCAYTEQFLCSESAHYHESLWVNGRYTGNYPKPDGQLDHFNPTLKKDKAWLWANFFMVHSDTNRRKSTKPVYDILKPDRPGYDPFALMDYDEATHQFVAKQDGVLSEDEKKQIGHMIDLLGLNGSNVRGKRETALEMRFFAPTQHQKDREFPTAYAMYCQRKETF